MPHQKTDLLIKAYRGYSVLEFIVAIFIFGCVSAAVFSLIAQTDRLYGRAVFVEGATRLAAAEAERLRSHAVGNVIFEDSLYTETISDRKYRVYRRIVEPDVLPSFERISRVPKAVEIVVSDETKEKLDSLRFKLLIGQDNP